MKLIKLSFTILGVIVFLGFFQSSILAQTSGKLENRMGRHFVTDTGFIGNQICHTDTLYNTGDTALTVNSFNLTGPQGAAFSIIGLTLPMTLPAHSGTILLICAKPTVTGWNDGIWTVYTTNGNPLSLTVPLRVFVVGQNSIENIQNGKVTLESSPNPFTTSTALKFHITSFSRVRMTVSDVSGKEISVLIDKNLEAGEYESKFKANDLPNGIYIITMNAGGMSRSVKISIVK